ncbi:MAG: acyl-CoA dehydrogenase, partial [bacterium]|nr:acyl-CoA dehydrogenase [bacterium]
IAQAQIDLEVFRMTGARALSSYSKRGVPGAEGSILKIFFSEMYQRVSRAAAEIAGPYGQLTEDEFAPLSYAYLRSRGSTIEAGTSEIMRNIIAERVLGLPKSY